MHTIPTPRVRLPIHNSTGFARATLLTLGALITLGSCAPLDWGPGPAPIEYRSVSVVIGDRGSLHREAGVHYEIASVATRDIVGFEVAFDLFDESSRPVPELGRNSFRALVSGRIGPGESRRYSISLDSIAGHPYARLVLSRFRVSRVDFDDGSQWRNSGAHLYEEDEA